jgi:hypothetical protein
VATLHDSAASQLPHGPGRSGSPLNSTRILVFIPLDFTRHTTLKLHYAHGHLLLDPFIILGKYPATMAPKYQASWSSQSARSNKRTFDQRITGFFSKTKDKTTNINTATPDAIISRSSPDLADPLGDATLYNVDIDQLRNLRDLCIALDQLPSVVAPLLQSCRWNPNTAAATFLESSAL